MNHTNTEIGRASARGNVRSAILAVMLFAGAAGTSARAGLIMGDDFNGANGTSPSAANWSSTTGFLLNGSGLAVASGSGHLEAQSSFNFLATSVTNYGRETIVFTNRNGQAIYG